ncbi:hypothetical protein G7046_g8232 [Stylonectria norvegica]|nr:hypothetical protein G7046_g8232 [Stylonectria norvegica]
MVIVFHLVIVIVIVIFITKSYAHPHVSRRSFISSPKSPATDAGADAEANAGNPHVDTSIHSDLHDLILGQAAVRIRVHGFASSLVQVLDKTEVERAAAVLVTLKLGNRGLGSISSVESDHASASRATTGFVLDLGLFHLADGGEQLNQIVVASGPWQLFR